MDVQPQNKYYSSTVGLVAFVATVLLAALVIIGVWWLTQSKHFTAVSMTALGSSEMTEKRYDLAIAEFTRAIAADPQYSEAYVDRSNAYRFKRDFARAIADDTTAIRIGRSDNHAYVARGLSLYDSKEYGKAMADFSVAAYIDPKDPKPLFVRSFVYNQQRNYDAEIADLTAAIAIMPGHAQYRLYRGVAFIQKMNTLLRSRTLVQR